MEQEGSRFERELKRHIDAKKHLNINPYMVNWRIVCYEAEKCVGKECTDAWLDKMQDIVNHPRFCKQAFPWPFIVRKMLIQHYPHLLGHTWVSPHPSQLGHYQVWTPDLQPSDVFSEDAVRQVLGIKSKL